MRLLAGLAAAASWIYSWLLIRQVRTEFQVFRLGQVPLWLLILLGITSTVLVTTAVGIWLRGGFWPIVSTLAGPLLFASILCSQFVVMEAVYESEFGSAATAGRPDIDEAFSAMLERKADGTPRGGLDLAIFVAGTPTLLFLSGLSGIILYRRLRPQEAGASG